MLTLDSHEVQVGADFILVFPLIPFVEQLLHRALDGSGNLIDVLWFHHGLEVIFENLGEVVLQLGTAEVVENLGPVGRVGEYTEVGFKLAG